MKTCNIPFWYLILRFTKKIAKGSLKFCSSEYIKYKSKTLFQTWECLTVWYHMVTLWCCHIEIFWHCMWTSSSNPQVLVAHETQYYLSYKSILNTFEDKTRLWDDLRFWSYWHQLLKTFYEKRWICQAVFNLIIW